MKGEIERFYPKEGYGYLLDSNGDKRRFIINQFISTFQIDDDIEKEIEPIRYIHVKKAVSEFEIEEEIKVVFDPIENSNEKFAENVVLIKEEWKEFLLSAELVYIELVKQTEQFLQFLKKSSLKLKPQYEKPDYQKIKRRIDYFKNNTTTFSKVEFKGPEIEIQVLIEGGNYKIGTYESEIICKIQVR